MLQRKQWAQGQSSVTEDKARGFGKAFAINLRIFQSRFAGKSWAKYFHFDLNSGSGHNDEAGCIGSPLAFLSAVHRLEVPNYLAFFVDISKDAVCELMIYPAWGAFDTPGNMKAACHRCHCERHGELFD